MPDNDLEKFWQKESHASFWAWVQPVRRHVTLQRLLSLAESKHRMMSENGLLYRPDVIYSFESVYSAVRTCMIFEFLTQEYLVIVQQWPKLLLS